MNNKKRIALATLFFCSFSYALDTEKKSVESPKAESIESVQAIKVVPSGMLSKKPIISESTFAIISKKSKLTERDFNAADLEKLDKKFNSVVNTLKKEGVFDKIKKIAPLYQMAPEAVAASIIGEHVFNVGIVDQFQNYFMSIYSKWVDKHSSVHHIYLNFLKEPEVSSVLKSSNSDYEKWDTLMDLYNQKYRGKQNYPNSSFIFSFFNPYGAGLTYGLGQLSPARILLTNDLAVKHGGLKKIDPTDTQAMYFATLDVETNIHYVAATNLASIINYKKYAEFDISQNIGVIATLYNLGNEKKRAQALHKINEQKIKNNQSLEFPVENFYGWFMNKKEEQIKQLLN